MDEVVLEDYFLPLDERLLARGVQGVEGGAEIRVDSLVAVIEREPVEANVAAAVSLLEDLDIGDVVAGPGSVPSSRSVTRGADAARRRAGQQAGEADGGLEDRISVGVLVRVFPCVSWSMRSSTRPGSGSSGRRTMPAWLTLYFTLALALFMDRGAARVMRKLAGVLAWAERGVAVAAPSEEALSRAGSAGRGQPLRLPFRGWPGSLRRPGAPGAWWRAAAGVAGRHDAGRPG